MLNILASQYFSDGPVRPSLVPESAESRHQTENLYGCPETDSHTVGRSLHRNRRQANGFHLLVGSANAHQSSQLVQQLT